jgi:hypothetical protein
MKKAIILAMLAFGMNATAQTVNRDSLSQDPVFQAKIKTAAFTVSKQVIDTATQDLVYYRYATLIRKEPTNQYWLNQLSFGVVYDYPTTDGSCPQDTITYRVKQIFNKYAEISGL